MEDEGWGMGWRCEGRKDSGRNAGYFQIVRSSTPPFLSCRLVCVFLGLNLTHSHPSLCVRVCVCACVCSCRSGVVSRRRHAWPRTRRRTLCPTRGRDVTVAVLVMLVYLAHGRERERETHTHRHRHTHTQTHTHTHTRRHTQTYTRPPFRSRRCHARHWSSGVSSPFRTSLPLSCDASLVRTKSPTRHSPISCTDPTLASLQRM